MASDVKQGRRRTDSSAASSAGHTRKGPEQAIQPKSSHTSDEFLREFLDPAFDPAAYLNAALPPLGRKQGPAAGQAGPEPVPLAEVSAQAQALLSQLDAHTTRLCDTLTELTDDIMRNGSRVAYQVELLRGEMLGLSELLHDKLQVEVRQFVPGGLPREAAAAAAGDEVAKSPAAAGTGKTPTAGGTAKTPTTGTAAAPGDDEADDPDFIKQLRMLTLVRSRIDSVIKTFGDAMDFTFPPSELSVGSSFLSVSAPEPGSQQQSSEEKGQQVLKQLRDEIAGLLRAGDDPVQGIEKAANRIEELKELASVWKGTAEEKGRNKFIESLAKMVEDRHRELMREMEQQASRRDGKSASADASAAKRTGSTRDAGATEDSKTLPGGFGLISQLQKLRNGL